IPRGRRPRRGHGVGEGWSCSGGTVGAQWHGTLGARVSQECPVHPGSGKGNTCHGAPWGAYHSSGPTAPEIDMLLGLAAGTLLAGAMTLAWPRWVAAPPRRDSREWTR